MADTAALKGRLNDIQGKFTLPQKILMGAVALAVVGAIFFVTKAASGEELAPLYSNLKPEDAAAVTEKLTADGTTYKLSDSGSTIMVDKSKVYDLRLKMAAGGLPQSGPEGYDLLDKQGITTSEFSQQVGYQRAMEGELAKTIDAMDPIDTSTVHLAMPKDNVFANDTTKASASVLVKTKAGKNLDTTQVQAIVHLVASSVQGLAPEDVTVADSAGNVLAAPGQDIGGAGGDLSTKTRSSYEAGKAAELTKLIEPVVGAGKAKVNVSADMDMSKSSTTSETFTQPSGNPTVTTPSQATTKTETYTGAGGQDAGVLGADGQTTTPTGTGGTDSSYNNSESSTKNALNRSVEQKTNAPGQVTRLSVAVLVDSSATTADQIGQIQNLISAAAGLDPARGDKIEVTRLEFDNSVADAQKGELEAAKAQAEKESMMGLIKQVVIVLLLALVLFFVYRSMRKSANRRVRGLVAGEVREIEAKAAREAEQTALSAPVITLPDPVDAVDPEIMQREARTTQVLEMIDNQPTEVAQLLRSWLGESKKGVKK